MRQEQENLWPLARMVWRFGCADSGEIIRMTEYAYVELVFSVTEEKRAALETMDVFPDEDGLLIISRKLLPARSVSKINDETVTAAKLGGR